MTATSSGFIDPIYSLFQVVSQTIPIRATPTPACANTVPQLERGNPRARRAAIDSGASVEPPEVHAHNTAIAISAATPAANSRCATPSRSPRFHAKSGPNGTAIIKGTNNGAKV